MSTTKVLAAGLLLVQGANAFQGVAPGGARMGLRHSAASRQATSSLSRASMVATPIETASSTKPLPDYTSEDIPPR